MSEGARKSYTDRTLDLLLNADGEPIAAIDLAEMLGMRANREAKRRDVRRIIKQLRSDGFRICACNNSEEGEEHNGQGGYWIAQSDAEWREYCEHRNAKAVFSLVDLRRLRTAARERRNEQAVMAH